MTPPDPDLEALHRMQAQDEDGLRELMGRHRGPIFRYIYRFVRNEADAAELTEQVFLKVYQNAPRFKPKAKVSNWMYTIAGNLCRDFLRRNKKRLHNLSLEQPLGLEKNFRLKDTVEADSPNPHQESVSGESLDEIEQAIQALPHRLKIPFIFCVLEDHSYDDCAKILKTNRKTVETRIYRARQKLREELG